MSEHIDYDPTLVTIEKADVVPSTVGGIVGAGSIGEDVSDWVPIKLATFSYSMGDDPDENGTLVYGTETATVSKSFWGDPEELPFKTGQKLRFTYDDAFEYLGTVEKVTRKRHSVPEARRHGARYAVTISASILGTYAVALSRQVCWTELPGELAIDRIRRWGVTVVNFDD